MKDEIEKLERQLFMVKFVLAFGLFVIAVVHI